jgi:exosortase C (VPDSG-CTERM-specific)
MNAVEPQGAKTKSNRAMPQGIDACAPWANLIQRARLMGWLGFIVLLVLVFIRPLLSLVTLAAGKELDSYILLVPFISAYLIFVRRKQLPGDYLPSLGLAMAGLAAGLVALAAGWFLRASGRPLSQNDYVALMTLSFICFLVAGGFLFMGRKWMAVAAFPVAFLMFMIPLPDRVADCLETALKLGSAEVANLFFSISGTPVLRDGVVFQLPGIVIEVAQECSGINSSMVLFMTGLLASHLFLKSPWRRTVLAVAVIPLGILRNGFRILVIGLLCVHIGPHMIHSSIHHRGGPLFFVLSLIPLLLLLWGLRRSEVGVRSAAGKSEGEKKEEGKAEYRGM